MKSSVFESRQLQSCSEVEIRGQARREERLGRSKLKELLLIDSDAEGYKWVLKKMFQATIASVVYTVTFNNGNLP